MQMMGHLHIWLLHCDQMSQAKEDQVYNYVLHIMMNS